MTLAGAAPGKLIGVGRYADVFDLGGGRVLRRYRNPGTAVDREAEVMEHARAHGVPVPEVFEANGPDIVMEQAVGPTMLQALTRRPWSLGSQAGLLAELHRLVNAVPALDRLVAPFGPGGCLVHTDLHPDNVILTQTGPRLIDWQGAIQGPAEAGMAMTWVLIASGEVPGPVLQRSVATLGRRLLASAYLGALQPSLDNQWLVHAAQFRLADPSLTAREGASLRHLLRSRRLRAPDPIP
ncbi:MAG: phosphotransferase [Acidimicrobiales bacterium]